MTCTPSFLLETVGIAFGSLKSSILPWWPDESERVCGRAIEKSVVVPDDRSLEST
jgi:hypothetical protein